MLFKNCYIENSEELSDILVRDGKFLKIGKITEPLPDEQTVDLGGSAVFPPFIESHIHLDTVYTGRHNRFSSNNTLFKGIANWAKIKNSMSVDETVKNAEEAIAQEMKMGVGAIRTHVDITSDDFDSLNALLDIRKRLADYVDIQIIAFPQDGIICCPGTKEKLIEAIKLGVDGIGAIPHYEYTHEYAVEALDFAAKLAAETGVMLDVHCDETDDDSSRGLETLAARAIELSLFGRVCASHTTATHSYNNAYFDRLLRTLRKSEINFVSNPLVNISLQGRFDTYPKRRGVTRIRELRDAGLNVSFGHDDIQDPWYPLGRGNPLDVVDMGLHVSQLLSHEDIMNSYKFVTENAAKTLNIDKGYGIAEGNDANFIVLDAENFFDALVNKPVVLYSVRRGKILLSSVPAVTHTNFDFGKKTNA